MNDMKITSAQYNPSDSGNGNGNSIKCVIDGIEMDVPLASGNRHYDEILRQVEAGELTIADAD